MGFAFENFDPVGRWRTHYPTDGRPQIDPATILSNGDQLTDIVAFKQMLLNASRILPGVSPRKCSPTPPAAGWSRLTAAKSTVSPSL